MYQSNEAKAFTMKNAEIFMKNFTGRAGKYTPEGTRTFMLRLPNDVAEELADDGWNVSYLRPREEGDLPTPALNVTVNFKYFRRRSKVYFTTHSRVESPLEQ